MSRVRRRILTNILLYLTGDSALKIAPLLALPFVITAVGPSEYAKIFYYNIAVNIGVLVHGLEIPRSLEYSYHKSVTAFSEGLSVVRKMCLALFVVEITVLFCLFLSLEELWVFNIFSLLCLIFVIPLTLVKNITHTYLRNKLNVTTALLLDFIIQSSTYLTLVLGVVLFGGSVEYYLVGTLIGHIIALPIYVKALLRFSQRKISTTQVLRELKAAMPFVPNSLKTNFINSYDKICISWFLGDSSVGVYGAIQQICSVFKLYTNSCQKAFGPVYLRMMLRQAAPRAILVNSVAGVIFLLSAVVFYWVIGMYIGYFQLFELSSVTPVITLLLFAMIFRGLLQIEYFHVLASNAQSIHYKESLMVVLATLTLYPAAQLLGLGLLGSALSLALVHLISFFLVCVMTDRFVARAHAI